MDVCQAGFSGIIQNVRTCQGLRNVFIILTEAGIQGTLLISVMH